MPLDISSRSESVSANRSDPKGSGHARDAHTFALEFSAHIGTIKLPFRKSLCYRGPRMGNRDPNLWPIISHRLRM
jgi:hypothetical protein